MIEWLVKKGYFRNENHAIWFVSSFGFFVLSICNYFYPKNLWMFLIIPTVVNLPPLITSINKIFIKKEEGHLYSKDCIWFNFLMICLYFALFFLAQWQLGNLAA